MPIRNQAWYDRNESRPFPISDEASAIDDDGVRLDSRAIADLHIAYPNDLGQRVFISAVAITPTLASVTLLATDSVGSPASFVPLAAISLVKPFDAYVMQPLTPLTDEVSGWIVFGREGARDDANVETFHGKFSTPAQSIVHPSCTRPFRRLPLESFGRLGEADPLTGLIALGGGTDIEVVKECREIPLVPGSGCDPNITTALDVIVVRLRDTVLTSPAGAAPAAQIPPGANPRNVFEIYSGPCAGRPESVTCGEPVPIELLASVPPDCDGNIDLVLRGCATPSRIIEEALVVDDTVAETQDSCGVVVDCDLSLGEACITPDRLPDPDGRLPNEYDDLCESLTSVTISLVPEEEVSDPTFSINEQSESLSEAAAPTLPYCNSFSSGDPDLVVVTGSFNYINSHGRQYWSTEGLSGESFRNVSLWDFEWRTFFKRVSARVQMLPGTSGALHNAAVVANYKETAIGSGRFSYYVAEIDYDGNYEGYKLFRIGRFNGTSWNTEFAVPVNALALNERYDIYLTIYEEPTLPDAAWLQAQLIGVDNPAINITIGPLLERNYAPVVGKFGMGTNRGPARFSNFCLENTGAISNGPPFV